MCQPGLINCGGTCVDPGTSLLHCGASGTCTNAGGGNTPGVACPPGNLCVAGDCVVSCPAGSVSCGGACVNPSTGNSYGGASGDCSNAGAGNSASHACAHGRLCNDGVCAVVCAAGLVNCNGGCVDPSSDNRRCGAAGDCNHAPLTVSFCTAP